MVSRLCKERQRQNAVKNVDEYVDEMQEVLKTKPKAEKEVDRDKSKAEKEVDGKEENEAGGAEK